MKEANELLEIWNHYRTNILYKYGKGFHKERYEFLKEEEDAMILFWTLKAKIDDYKKQIIDAEKEVDRLMEILDNYP